MKERIPVYYDPAPANYPGAIQTPAGTWWVRVPYHGAPLPLAGNAVTQAAGNGNALTASVTDPPAVTGNTEQSVTSESSVTARSRNAAKQAAYRARKHQS